MRKFERRPPASRAVLSVNTALAYLAMGVSGAIIGPALPWLAQHWHVALDATGVLITLLFAGSCASIVASGFLLDRIGSKPLLVAGLFLVSAGLAGLAGAGDLGLAGLASSGIGLGWGCLVATLNVFVADLYPAARVAALNLMNFFFGVGALLAPLAVGALLSAGLAPGWAMAAWSGVALVSSGLYRVLGFPRSPAPVDPAAPPEPTLRLLRDRYVLTLAVLFFVYVGLEAGFGSWATSLAIAGAHFDASVAALVSATYWTAFTLARLGAGLLTRYLGGAHLVLGGALLAAAGAGVMALFTNVPAVFFVGAAIIGVGCAPIFPTAFALATARYPARAGAMSSIVVLGGSLGGAVLPYLLGWVLTHSGAGAAAGALALLSLLVAGLQVVLGWATAPRNLCRTRAL